MARTEQSFAGLHAHGNQRVDDQEGIDLLVETALIPVGDVGVNQGAARKASTAAAKQRPGGIRPKAHKPMTHRPIGTRSGRHHRPAGGRATKTPHVKKGTAK